MRHVTALHMNAGLMADLPSLEGSGAEGVGLFRTELQFLVRNQHAQTRRAGPLYARVIDASGGRRVAFRTLDIGSDKVLPYLKPQDEPNPAMGWRAIRVGLDKPGVLRMQLQALFRAANGRPLTIMFPFITETSEFFEARAHLTREIHREKSLGHPVPTGSRSAPCWKPPASPSRPTAFSRQWISCRSAAMT
jgi:phosphotransferase system, enzyme I, PtsP